MGLWGFLPDGLSAHRAPLPSPVRTIQKTFTPHYSTPHPAPIRNYIPVGSESRRHTTPPASPTTPQGAGGGTTHPAPQRHEATRKNTNSRGLGPGGPINTPKATPPIVSSRTEGHFSPAVAAAHKALNQATSGGGSSGGGGSTNTGARSTVGVAPSVATANTGGATTDNTSGAEGTTTPGTTLDTPPKAPETETITIPGYEADATYKGQIKDLIQAIADYKAQIDTAKQQYGDQYNLNLKRLGWNAGDKSWDRSFGSRGDFGRAWQDNLNDYAARGLGNSGFYGQSISDIQNAFNDQKTDLDTALTNYDTSQDTAYTTANNANLQSQEDARQEAVGRLAAKYGVDPSKVPTTGSVKITRPVATAS